jgi:DNA-binding NarL/FixJ family response regulator
MVKILLVYEDFNELTLTESYLKRVGFDVVGIGNEVLLHDQILSFRPDIIVAHGKNARVSSFSVGQKMKENQRYSGKVVIVVPKDVRPSPQDVLHMKMDGIIESPVQPEKLIQVLCRLGGQAPTSFLEKFQKARLSDPELGKRLFMVTGSATPMAAAPTASPPSGASGDIAAVSGAGVAIDDPQRVSRYKKFTDGVDIDLKHSTHQRQDIKEKQNNLKKGWDFDKLEDQDLLRQQFAEALFKKRS